MISVSTRTFVSLRETLEREIGDRAATVLQELGYASGEGVYDDFADWVNTTHGVGDPAALSAERLEEVLRAYFNKNGWGELSLEKIGAGSVFLTTQDWAESSPESRAQFPSCHVSTGMFADFLSRLADGTVAVMEVSCRSQGDSACGFLIGSPETLQTVYDQMLLGRDFRSVLT